jgi:hypothetical protein
MPCNYPTLVEGSGDRYGSKEEDVSSEEVEYSNDDVDADMDAEEEEVEVV